MIFCKIHGHFNYDHFKMIFFKWSCILALRSKGSPLNHSSQKKKLAKIKFREIA